MFVCFGFLAYAVLEGIDRRILGLTDPERRCAAVRLCGACVKSAPVPCGLKRAFYLFIPALMIVAMMIPTADWRDNSYNTLIFGEPYNYGHLRVFQQLEDWYCPAAAVVMFGASLAILLFKRRDPIGPAKIAFAAGFGPLGFGMFRHAAGRGLRRQSRLGPVLGGGDRTADDLWNLLSALDLPPRAVSGLRSMVPVRARLSRAGSEAAGGGTLHATGIEAAELLSRVPEFPGPGDILVRFGLLALLGVGKTPNPIPLSIFRVESDDLRKVRNGLVVLALFLVCPAAVAIAAGIFRVQPDRLRQVLNSPVPLALFPVGSTPVIVRIGHFRIDPDRLRQVPNTLVEVALILVGSTPVIVRMGIFRIDPDRLRQVRNGLVPLALFPVGSTPVIVRIGIFRIDPDRFRAVRNGLVPSPFFS